MIQIVGTYAGTDVEDVVPPQGDPFVSRTIRVMTAEGRTYFVRESRDFFGEMPEVGKPIRLGVWPRPYVNKNSDSLGCGWTAYCVLPAAAPAAAVSDW